jgi:lipid-A-disaccharide synthase
MTNKRIAIVAGDKSADSYAALLCRHLKAASPEIEIYTFAGSQTAAYSRQILNLVDHSVTGLVEVLRSLPKIIGKFNRTFEEINRIKPDLVILCDFPDFNLRLAQKLNKRYPLYYYISPQVWAWRKERVEIIRKYVDKMIVIFKFEEEFFLKEKIPVLYFGHPLLELIKTETVKPEKTISFMPGSRKSVLKQHLPIVIRTKDFLAQKLPGYRFRIIRPENIPESFYKGFPLNMEIIPHSYQALSESEFVVASSGTSGIELAVLEVPYILIYKMNPLSWFMVKRLVNVSYAGMVNILAKKPLIKELLQKKTMPLNVAVEVLRIINDPKAYSDIKNGLAQVKDLLKPEGAAESFANHIVKTLQAS